MNIIPLPAPRSPLFAGAVAILAGTDRAAVLLCLRDQLPGYSLAQIDAALRETAVTFHCETVRK